MSARIEFVLIHFRVDRLPCPGLGILRSADFPSSVRSTPRGGSMESAADALLVSTPIGPVPYNQILRLHRAGIPPCSAARLSFLPDQTVLPTFLIAGPFYAGWATTLTVWTHRRRAPRRELKPTPERSGEVCCSHRTVTQEGRISPEEEGSLCRSTVSSLRSTATKRC
jgi:hypothetical protein